MSRAAASRLFIALWPDDATRAALAERRDAWTWAAGATPQADPRLHLTLHFLGAVEHASVPRLLAALPPCGPAFELALERAALWPNGIAALEAEAVVAPLAALHRTLAQALTGAGFATDPRAFRPHVTLARRARGSLPPQHLPTLRWAVDGYALVRSGLGSATYEVLQTFD